MPKNVLLILAEGFEDVEAVTAVDVLRRAGVSVTTAGLSEGLVTGSRGTRVSPDETLEKAKGGEYDALVLPGGGKGADNLAASPVVRDLILKFHKAGKVVAAICAAPAVVLAPVGILEGKKVTGFPGTEGGFPSSSVVSTDPVVVDGNLITSRALGTALAFSLALAEKLVGRETSEKVRRSVLG